MTESGQYTEIMIGGKLYRLSSEENEEYMQQMAIYLNGRLSELKQTEGFGRLPADYQNLLLQMNIADDYFKAREQEKRLERQVEELEKALYQVKHDLITTQMKFEEASRGSGQENDSDPDSGLIVFSRREKPSGRTE